jgi:hypothetical protein
VLSSHGTRAQVRGLGIPAHGLLVNDEQRRIVDGPVSFDKYACVRWIWVVQNE